MHHFPNDSQNTRKENSSSKHRELKFSRNTIWVNDQQTYADGERNIGKADPEKRQGYTFRPQEQRPDINKLFAGYREIQETDQQITERNWTEGSAEEQFFRLKSDEEDEEIVLHTADQIDVHQLLEALLDRP